MATTKKIVIREVFLDKIMRLDSNLHKIIVDSLIDSIQFYNNPSYKNYWHKRRYPVCPVNMQTVRYISEYLRAVYLSKRRDTINQLKFDNFIVEENNRLI